MRVTGPTTPDPGPALALGLAVFPVTGRRPARPDWASAGTRDRAEIRRWPPGANPGIGCRTNGLVVLDIDRHADGPDGLRALRRLCESAGTELPATLTVRTPHGLHLYFRAPTLGRFASGALTPGVDVRAPGRRSGGYVLGPGSVVDGRPYTAEPAADIAELPEWLASLMPGRRRVIPGKVMV